MMSPLSFLILEFVLFLFFNVQTNSVVLNIATLWWCLCILCLSVPSYISLVASSFLKAPTTFWTILQPPLGPTSHLPWERWALPLPCAMQLGQPAKRLSFLVLLATLDLEKQKHHCSYGIWHLQVQGRVTLWGKYCLMGDRRQGWACQGQNKGDVSEAWNWQIKLPHPSFLPQRALWGSVSPCSTPVCPYVGWIHLPGVLLDLFVVCSKQRQHSVTLLLFLCPFPFSLLLKSRDNMLPQ